MGVTDVGMQHALATEYLAGTPVTTWYLGIVDNSGWTAFNFGDTAASHSSWAEFTGYSNSTRVAWTPASGGSSPNWTASNSTTNDFSITSSGTLKGLFLISNSTKSGTTGTLAATAAFSGGTQGVGSGDTLKATFTMTGTAT